MGMERLWKKNGRRGRKGRDKRGDGMEFRGVCAMGFMADRSPGLVVRYSVSLIVRCIAEIRCVVKCDPRDYCTEGMQTVSRSHRV